MLKYNIMKYLFGPVKSRRLGRSLGVDLVPSKTCTLNCLYCQLGRSGKVTALRKPYAPEEAILAELDTFFRRKHEPVDHITLSGSGEPTLHAKIEKIIRRIKEFSPIPVAVITNGTLLYRPAVRRALLNADAVLPSLDAVSEPVFQRVNRPAGAITARRLVAGLRNFSREYPGKLFLEIMLVKGVNDSPDDLEGLRDILNDIRVTRVQLNTVVRPPAEPGARALTRTEMNSAAAIIGHGCEIIADFTQESGGRQKGRTEQTGDRRIILETLKRRPLSVREITQLVKGSPAVTDKLLKDLAREGLVTEETVATRRFYRITARQP